MHEPIRFDIGSTSLGPVLVAVTAQGVCAVSLADDEAALRADLARSCSDAVRDHASVASTLAAVIAAIDSPSPTPTLSLDFRGTDFQRRVWSALLAIPRGHTETYASLTARLGLAPTSIRAVGQAVARNPIAVLVPCHRVIRSDGALAGYRWGLARKQVLLDRERTVTKGRGPGFMSFKDHFSRHAELYRRYRPTYPDAVFAWLASITNGRSLALDVGTGNGQAAVKLADHFDQVLATDASGPQITAATPHPKVHYRVAQAEDSGLADASVDLVLAAQAFHWFDFEAFFAECRRVVRSGGIVAALTYFHPTIAPAVDLVLERYIDHVRADWPPERRFVNARYANAPWPFDEIEIPLFEMTLALDLDAFLGYLATWSAAQRYRERTNQDPRVPFVAAFSEAWGDPHRPTIVRFPLGGRVGRVP